MQKFHLFYGGVFSQWYHSPMTIDGVQYNCAEQYMMAQKARVFQDGYALCSIMESDSPSEQKAIGRGVKGFNQPVWDSVSRAVVMRASLAKFTSSERLLDQLMDTTGRLLVEASPTDVIWGIGLAENDPRCHDREQWRGTNWLGQVLTDLREHLRSAGA